MFYTPDFLIMNTDNTVEYHEVKGYMDPASATKLRRMSTYYKDVKLTLIDRKAYRAVEHMMSRLIPYWETNATTMSSRRLNEKEVEMR